MIPSTSDRSTVHELFARSAVANGGRTAVVDGDRSITYRQLENFSNQLAATMVDVGVLPGDRVMLLLAKSVDAVAAMLAVMKIGAIFTPLDTESPPARLRPMVATAEPVLILTDGNHRPLLDDLLPSPLDRVPGLRIGLIDRELDADEGPPERRLPLAFDLTVIEAASTAPPPVAVDADDLAYLLFTSGSTGAPKGVPIRHISVVAFVGWANEYFAVGPGDRQSAHSPLHFDLSVHDVFGSLLAGAELHLVDPNLNLLPTTIVDFMAERRLVQWFSVPSVLRAIAARDGLAGRELPALRRLLWCGEALPTVTLRYWMEHLPAVEFTNLYGPTEATIASSYHTVESCPAKDSEPVPIGVACGGESLHVLDDGLRPVAPDVVGQLFLGGVGLSPGYWRDGERTAEAFVESRHVPDAGRLYRTGDLARIDDNGLAHFLGRNDRQIKSRGFRIELDEIAGALAGLDELSHSAVVAVDTPGFEGTTICAAYVLKPTSDASPASLRTQLANAIPSYMLPGRWLAVAEIPTTPNGKIDHRAVIELFAEAASSSTRPK